MIRSGQIGAILGLSPYQTREDALRSMVREYHGAASEFVTNPAIEWRRANQETAIGIFEMKSGYDIRPAGYHTFEDIGSAHPDAFVDGDGVLINKCPYGIRNEDPPRFKTLLEQPHYYAKAQWEIAITGRTRYYFNQWTPHGDIWSEGGVDQDWLNYALPEIRQFYAFYLAEIENPEHLEPLRVEINTQEAGLLMAEYDEMKDARDRADERMKELIGKFAAMTNGKNGLIDGRKFTMVEKAGSIAYARVVKEHCKNVDLEPYRGKPSTSWRVT